MTDIYISQGVSAAAPASTRTAVGSASPNSDNVAFRALLERLEREARALDDQVQQVDDPRRLAQAVDRAHASLQDALSLSDRLLEAFRQATTAADSPATRRTSRS